MRPRRAAFTLIELLVVILIIGLVSAAVLPTAIPAIAHRQVSEAARILQATISSVRDAAIRAGAPRGIRLMPDPILHPSDVSSITTFNRVVPIEPGPDYSNGYLNLGLPSQPGWLGQNGVNPSFGESQFALRVEEAPVDNGTGAFLPPTGWFWNIRVGDQLRIADGGRWYTVVGPLVLSGAANPEGFVNAGPPGTASPVVRTYGPSPGIAMPAEYLLLVNGQDDNGNGFVDEGFDGLDNDGLNGPDDLFEWEAERFTGAWVTNGVNLLGKPYTIARRPVPTQGARETALPADVVIDATSWLNAPAAGSAFPVPERSRLPIDFVTTTINGVSVAWPNYVEIMINSDGQVLPPVQYLRSSYAALGPFYHFWLAERQDVFEPQVTPNQFYTLPMPAGTQGYQGGPRVLKGERRLVSLNKRTGLVTVAPLDEAVFNVNNPNHPFYEARMGARATD